MRTKGLATVSRNYEPQIGEPFDARLRVGLKSDLTDTNVWEAPNGQVYTYKGIVVSVYDDTEDNNGVYYLKGSDYTQESSWEKVGTGDGDVQAFTGLTDTPNSYEDTNYIRSTASGLEYRTPTQVLSDINAEEAFSKGDLIQGSNVTLTGTLTNRLVGSGDITIDVTVPSAGSLNTTCTTALATSSSESFTGNISLHRIAKTGCYEHLSGTPTVNNSTITIAAGTSLCTGGDFTTNQSTDETITINHVAYTSISADNTGAVIFDKIGSDSTGHLTNVGCRTLTASDISAEPAFSKGGFTEGTGVSLSGTLTNRLVDSGNVTISLDTTYTDNRYVEVAGDEMTGDLTMNYAGETRKVVLSDRGLDFYGRSTGGWAMGSVFRLSDGTSLGSSAGGFGGETSLCWFYYGGDNNDAGMYINSDKQVSIGTTSFTEKLSVNGFISSSSGYKVGTNTVISSVGDFSGNNADFEGNVGIGISSPSEKLDIDGQIRIRGGSPGTDKVLVSDANGVGTWETLNITEAHTVGSLSTGAVCYNGYSAFAGRFYAGSSNPTGGCRLNYSGCIVVNGLCSFNQVIVGGTTTYTPIRANREVGGTLYSIEQSVNASGQGAFMYSTDGGSASSGIFFTDTGVGVANSNNYAPTQTLDVDGNVGVTGDIIYDSGGNRSICFNAASTTTGRELTIEGNRGASTSNGGDIIIRGGCGGTSAGGGGDLLLCAGAGTGFNSGGDIHICSGGGSTSGDVYIRRNGISRFATLASGSCLYTCARSPVFCATTCATSPVFCASSCVRSLRFCGYSSLVAFCSVSGCGVANDWVANSDRRLKTNIQPISNALSIVNNLCGVFYNDCFGEKNKNNVGLIAQEVEKFLPEVVSKNKPTEEDVKNFGITDIKYGLKYDKFSAVLIEAIKEQQKQIDTLNNKINKLLNL
ncbi:MAG: tail fiber domain-containing protein [bacterium]